MLYFASVHAVCYKCVGVYLLGQEKKKLCFPRCRAIAISQSLTPRLARLRTFPQSFLIFLQFLSFFLTFSTFSSSFTSFVWVSRPPGKARLRLCLSDWFYSKVRKKIPIWKALNFVQTVFVCVFVGVCLCVFCLFCFLRRFVENSH